MMPADPLSVSPEFMAFAQELFDFISAKDTRPAIEQPLRVKAHARIRSSRQKVVLSAVQTGLMRRNKHGQFTGLDPRLKAKLAQSHKAEIARTTPTRKEIQARQRATFALVP